MSLLLLFKACWHIPWCGTWWSLLLLVSFYGLYAFCRNCQTTSLFTYNVNEKHQIYMPVISHCSCCSNLVSAFFGTLWCFPLSKSFYTVYEFCRNYLTTSLPIYDVNKKPPIYIPVISYCCYCFKLVSISCWHILLYFTVVWAESFYVLHAFCRNCLTTFLSTNDVNKIHPI